MKYEYENLSRMPAKNSKNIRKQIKGDLLGLKDSLKD